MSQQPEAGTEHLLLAQGVGCRRPPVRQVAKTQEHNEAEQIATMEGLESHCPHPLQLLLH